MIASRMTSPAAALALCGTEAGARAGCHPPRRAYSMQICATTSFTRRTRRASSCPVFADVRPACRSFRRSSRRWREPAALLPAWLQAERCTTTRGPEPLRLASLSWRVLPHLSPLSGCSGGGGALRGGAPEPPIDRHVARPQPGRRPAAPRAADPEPALRCRCRRLPFRSSATRTSTPRSTGLRHRARAEPLQGARRGRRPRGVVGRNRPLPRHAGRVRVVAAVTAAAEREAGSFPEYAFFAAQEARPVLAQFRVALPRNLVFAPRRARESE